MNFTNSEDQRTKASRRRTRSLANFPFIDSKGEPVLWERRNISGRRRTDLKTHWSRKDIPGLLLMGILFILLTAALLYWRMNSETFTG
jgi:hypothetical protein